MQVNRSLFGKKKKLFLKTGFIIILLLIILTRFWVVGMAKVLSNSHSSDGDESAYLTLGIALREDAILTDGTRPPLYSLLLAPFAEREWNYFTSAKILTLGIGAITIVAVFFVGRGIFSWKTGLLAAFLLAANKEFHLRASTIYADTLMVAMFLGAWYFLIKSFEKRFNLYLAGLFVGLAYLTKGSAPLLLGAWGIVALLRYRTRIIFHKELLIVPITFLLTISFLLIYNLRTFDSPFYNFATTHVMWMDRWSQSQVADPDDLPTLSTYFQTHTTSDIKARIKRGIEKLTPVLSRTLIPSRTWEPIWLGTVFWLGVSTVLGYFLLCDRQSLTGYYRCHSLTIQFSSILFAAFYFFSMWYAYVIIESRFLTPLLGPFYLLLADVIISLFSYMWRKIVSVDQRSDNIVWSSFLKWSYLIGITILFSWIGWWLANGTWLERWSLTIDPFVSDQKANAESESILTWFENQRPIGDVQIKFGPSKSLPLWRFPDRFRFQQIPIDLDSWSKLDKDLRANTPDYIIIDDDTSRRRRQALSDFFSYQNDAVQIEQMPKDWTLVYFHKDSRWYIFEPFTILPITVYANFDGKIELVGHSTYYEQSEHTLRVTLYWRSIAPLSKDYTVFLHLTALDGYVKAQQDKQPFNGLLPTTAWHTNRTFADSFDIELDDDVQSDDYLLLTGIYLPETGERLPVVNGPLGPSTGSVLLEQLAIER